MNEARVAWKLAANLAAKPWPTLAGLSEVKFLHHSCDTAHYINQSYADLSRRDDGFARMGAVAKRSIRNGLQTGAFDGVAVFAIELFVAIHHTPSISARAG